MHCPLQNTYKNFMKQIRLNLEGCWIWTGSVKNSGYGGTSFMGQQIMAHQLAYAIFVGDIPEGKLVLHECDIKLCCNPDHLYIGTHSDNSQDMHNKGRGYRGGSI